ncbi:conserved membrane hypothetical protein [Arthrobacter sp. 9AX]|uniref:hypothetical protein n=1 Tax=Arthrobacter sp. 9AX TaxID=2653131 RepID=UPI0012F463CE|nr:hypothetical protein [Arthrobacter sp. 9AX]VXB70073.1 conserved membrane hypothetical protein [Arthrobacter sp. 9AX]
MTLGSLWQLPARETQGWMIGGTASVLLGVGLGVPAVTGFLAHGESELSLLLPSLAFSLGGGYAVLFPGIRVNRSPLRVVRDWKHHPGGGKVLWVLSHAVAVAGLVACIIAGRANPALPGLLVWLFMGPYLALSGWAAAMLGMAAHVRAAQALECAGNGGRPAEVRASGQ